MNNFWKVNSESKFFNTLMFSGNISQRLRVTLYMPTVCSYLRKTIKSYSVISKYDKVMPHYVQLSSEFLHFTWKNAKKVTVSHSMTYVHKISHDDRTFLKRVAVKKLQDGGRLQSRNRKITISWSCRTGLWSALVVRHHGLLESIWPVKKWVIRC